MTQNSHRLEMELLCSGAMCWNLQLNVILHCHDLPGYISISDWKEEYKLCSTDLLYFHYCIHSRIAFPFVLVSLNNCWFVYLIFQEKIRNVYSKDYVPITSPSYDFSSQIWGFLCPLLGVALKSLMVLSKWLWKVTLLMPPFSKQSVTPNYWGQCGKIHLLETEKAVTCSPFLALRSPAKLWLCKLLLPS